MGICITGGNGFVGTRLAGRLTDRNERYRLLMRKNGTPRDSDHVVTCDFQSEDSIRDGLNRCETLVNLIGRFDPPFGEQLAANTELPYRLFRAAGESGVKRVIHVSAAAVYGDAMIPGPCGEETPPRPSTAYALSKLFGEEVLFSAARQYGFTAVALRPTNIYGNGARAGVVHALLSSVRASGKMNITGDGQQRRDLLHVDDFVEAIIAVCKLPKPRPVYNVSSSQVYSLKDLAGLIAGMIPGGAEIVKVPEAAGFVRSLDAESSLLRETGWTPTHSVKEDIAAMLGTS